MSKANVEQPDNNERQSSYAFEAFDKFIARHLVDGHEVRLLLDRNGNSYSIFCVTCDPRMAEVVQTRH